MPQGKGVRVTLLVEDRTLERFAREVLMQLGFHRGELRVRVSPAGRGSAKQWVEEQYPIEVRACRRKANFQEVGLLVGVEADEKTVRQEFARLGAGLADSKLPDRDDKERIAIWIPKWHVETWILHLLGTEVDENRKYKTAVKNPDYRAVAKAFVDRFRGERGTDPKSLPSLQTALEETKRLV